MAQLQDATLKIELPFSDIPLWGKKTLKDTPKICLNNAPGVFKYNQDGKEPPSSHISM